MIADAFEKSVAQANDPGFRKVFLLGVFMAGIVFLGVFALVMWLMPEGGVSLTGIGWIDRGLSWMLGFAVWPAFIISLWLLFPAISTLFMGLFLDDVVDAVEDKHYPGHVAARRLGMGRASYLALRMGAQVILLNLLAIPFYILLLFTAVGPFILFFVLNSFLLGREYFELVAARHYPGAGVKAARRAIRDRVFLTGGLIAGMFMIPVINLAAPIIGAAAMTHLFHMSRPEREARS